MAGVEELFPETAPEPTLSVTELSALVRGAVERAFPAEVWVRGEVQRCSRSRAGHLYFTLVEQKAGRPQASLAAACFARALRRVERRLAEVPGLEIADDVELRVRGRVSYYVPNGQLQLEVTDVDPYFTAGQLAARRARVLAALRGEGLLDRNRQHAFPVAPLHIGLVTSVGSAAYSDFVHELEGSGIGFRVTVADAPVQGQGAAPALVASLRACLRARPDVVVVVRGGGAKHDLAAFDHEALARAIATAPVPVLTGVGHQTDRSVADEVAFRSFKTPTACARALVEHVRESHQRALDAWAGVTARAERLVERDSDFVAAAAVAIRRHARMHLRVAAARADALGRGIRSGAMGALGRSRTRLARDRARIGERARGRLLVRAGALEHARDRVVRAAVAGFPAADRRIDEVAARLRLLDPANVLARGYSITIGDNGRVLRSRADARPGALLHTRLADGTVHSRVEGTESE